METQYKTGAFANPDDNRDIKYSDLPATVLNLPSKHITDISMLPILDQGSLGTCVAHALVYVKMYQEYKETGKVPKFSRRFIYALARQLSYYGTGEGLYPRDGGKVVKDSGVLEPDTIDDNTLPHEIYIKYSPTQAEKDSAKKWSAGFVTVNQGDLSSIKQAIIKEGVITISLDHDGSVWNRRTGKLKAPKNPTGRHYITLYGYEDKNGDTILYFINSWGEDWGDDGKGQFNWADYSTHSYDVLVFTDVPNDLIEKAKNTQFLFTMDLKLGMTHPHVAKLQERLRDEGFYKYPEITGYFGPVTKQAAIDYQKANGIKPAEGYVGPITRAKLNEPVKKKPNLTISQAGLDLIKGFESLHDGNPKTKVVEPMLDPVGYPTIGWGSRYGLDGKEITMKTPAITLAECDLLLKRDVAYIGTELNKYVLNQNQFDALTSFCYNLGVGSFQKSQIAENLKTGAPITEEMWTVYSHAKDQKTGKYVQLRGLVIRRQKEFALFKK